MNGTESPVFCSTVIPTVGRATLSRAVTSVLSQDFARAGFEVIVVNDAGRPLAVEPWRESPRVTVVDTNRSERSIARNSGAAVAKGQYLHFLDDDDELLPGGLETFWQLRQRHPDAAWLSGGWQTVDNSGGLVAEFTPALHGDAFAMLVSGESVPLQASLLAASAVRLAGGFDPALVGVEDRDLGRRVALHGHLASSTRVVSRIRIGEQGSTTNWTTLAEGDRRGREKALASPGACARVRLSANTPLWRGRVMRAYLASVVWNARRRHFGTAGARVAGALAMAGPCVASPEFWRGLRTRNP